MSVVGAGGNYGSAAAIMVAASFKEGLLERGSHIVEGFFWYVFNYKWRKSRSIWLINGTYASQSADQRAKRAKATLFQKPRNKRKE